MKRHGILFLIVSSPLFADKVCDTLYQNAGLLYTTTLFAQRHLGCDAEEKSKAEFINKKGPKDKSEGEKTVIQVDKATVDTLGQIAAKNALNASCVLPDSIKAYDNGVLRTRKIHITMKMIRSDKYQIEHLDSVVAGVKACKL
jgi:hypothetical protein